MKQDEEENGLPPNNRSSAGSLVPLYGGAEIVPGIQAFRRGDVVLYTVRGEPRTVQELIGQLDKDGIGEVIALITHQAEEQPADADEVHEDEDN